MNQRKPLSAKTSFNDVAAGSHLPLSPSLQLLPSPSMSHLAFPLHVVPMWIQLYPWQGSALSARISLGGCPEFFTPRSSLEPLSNFCAGITCKSKFTHSVPGFWKRAIRSFCFSECQPESGSSSQSTEMFRTFRGGKRMGRGHGIPLQGAKAG